MIKLAIVGVILFSGACLLTSCGHKGALYLPEPEKTQNHE